MERFHADDLVQDNPKDAYKVLCLQLSRKLQEFAAYLPTGNPKVLEHAQEAVVREASKPRDQDVGALDRSMTRMLRGIEPGSTRVNRTEVVDALCTHLQAAQMLARQASADSLGTELMDAGIQEDDSMEADGEEMKKLDVKRQVSSMVRALSLHAVSRKHAVRVLESALARAADLSWHDGINLFDPVLGAGQLNSSQLEMLAMLEDTFQQEYRLRRQMLIKRVGVTLQSFIRSSRVVENKAEVEAAVDKAMEGMDVAPSVSLDGIYKVTHYDLIMMGQKTSFGSRNSFASSVKSVLMGAVPDRGGRPGDRRAARMPSFQPREEDADPGRKRQGRWHPRSKKKSTRG